MASAELVSGRVLAALTGRPACGPSCGRQAAVSMWTSRVDLPDTEMLVDPFALVRQP